MILLEDGSWMHVTIFHNKLLQWFTSFKDGSRESVGERLQKLVESLPEENKSLLKYILEHLYRSEKLQYLHSL